MSIRIDGARDALGIIDVQPAFMPGGNLPAPDGDAVVPVINRLVGLPFAFRFASQDWHPRGHASFASNYPDRRPLDTIERNGRSLRLWPDHALKRTAEAALHPALDDGRIDVVLRKGSMVAEEGLSAFGEAPPGVPSGLASMLRERGVGRVFLVGLALDVCVAATAEDAARGGFDTVVVVDACRPSAPDLLEPTVLRLTEAGVTVVRAFDLE